MSRGLDFEAKTRDRHQEVLEILRRLCLDEPARGDNHDSIFAVPGYHLRPIVGRAVDDLAEPGLRILNLPSVDCSPPECICC